MKPIVSRLTRSSLRNVLVLAVVAVLAVALLAASSVVLASRQVTRVVDEQLQRTAAVSSVVVAKQLSDIVAVVAAYAARPSLAAAVAAGAGGDAQVDATLADLDRAVPGISASFVADLEGDSRNVSPADPAVIGTNFAYRDWFRGVVRTGRPYVSVAYQTRSQGRPLAVTVVAFVRSADGAPVGILGINDTLTSLGAFSVDIGQAQSITLTVTDQVGTSLTPSGAKGLVSLAADPGVRAARAGHSGLLDYRPPRAGGAVGPEVLAAYAPIPGLGWTVVAAIPRSVALAGLARLRATVLVIAALLVLLLFAGVRVVAVADKRRRASERQAGNQEQRLIRVVSATDEGYLSMDAAGHVTMWGQRAEQLFGWTAAEILGRSVFDTVVVPESRQHLRATLRAYQDGAPAAMVGNRVEMVLLHRDGHEIPVEIGLWAHDDDDGLSGLVHDISKRVADRAELESARDEAMQASRLKSAFLANMSHEIRTPMNGVIGMSGLLLDTALDAEQRDYAETVSSSAEALLTVIDDILDFSKIEAGKLDVESVPFDLSSVIEESAALLAARAQHQKLELTCRIDPAIPAALLGDPGRLRQVLLNLLGNAVKFTAAGEVNLSARLAAGPVDGRVEVELSVRDTGIGIPEATLGHLFDAFTQADTSTSRRYGGTGLGLAISRQLVELMGGTLSVSSEPGDGSTFTALVPFPVGVGFGVVTEQAGPLEPVGLRVLVVDANQTSRRVIHDMVIHQGCVAADSDGAAAALVLLRDAVAAGRPFEAVLLDLNLPDVDGYPLARLIRADRRLEDTTMIMLTSSAQRREFERAGRAGVVSYLTKPVRAAQLRAALTVAATVSRAPAPARESLMPAPAALASVRAEPVSAHRDPGPDQDADRPRVLVVEDNPVNQRVLGFMLTGMGYRVDVAANGVDGLDALERDRYAAVFMDCQMPGMDGYEVTGRLREREGSDRHTLVIAVTASAMAADRARCLDAGMDEYLTKPIRRADLVEVLTRVLDPAGRVSRDAAAGADPASDLA